jgi:hypothetical protein
MVDLDLLEDLVWLLSFPGEVDLFFSGLGIFIRVKDKRFSR